MAGVRIEPSSGLSKVAYRTKKEHMNATKRDWKIIPSTVSKKLDQICYEVRNNLYKDKTAAELVEIKNSIEERY